MIRPRNLLLVMCIIAVAALIGAATRFSGAPAMVDIAQERCPNKIEDFKNSVNWYRGKNRITFHAKEACGTKLGDSYDLTDVTLDVRSGDRVITQIHSDTGAFFVKSHEVMIGKTDQANPKGCLTGFNVMTIDLVSGELRTPGFRTFLNTVGPVQCDKQQRQHASRTVASVGPQTRIVNAYQDTDQGGDALVLEMNSQEFPSGNVFFAGDHQKVKQLEVTWDNSNQDERDVTFVSSSKLDVSEMVIRPGEAQTTSREKKLRSLKKLCPGELALLEKKMNRRGIRLAKLPQVLRSAFLFQVESTGEYVLVKEPVFDFHGNYEVFVGKRDHLRKIAVLAPEDWKNSPSGEIRFKDGGGLYIPKLAHFLITVSTQLEPPTLIRSKKAQSEMLVLPKLSRSELAQFGFGPAGALVARSISSRP